MRRRLKHGWWLSVPLALAVSACLPQGLRVPQSPLSRLLEPKSGTIAFLAADGNIYTTDQGGTSQTQITTDAFVEGESYRFYNMPTWSPDNQSLAFASFAGDSSDAPSDVALLTANPDGSNLVTAYSSPNFVVFYYWSPDGKRVGFISETPTNSLVFQVVPREGGDATLVDAGSQELAGISVDGRSKQRMGEADAALDEHEHAVLDRLVDLGSGSQAREQLGS